MADPIHDGYPTVMLICGDDADAKVAVTELTESLDFKVVDLGPLETFGCWSLLPWYGFVWL
jgi:predicted dinucleotide-binding enzyme